MHGQSRHQTHRRSTRSTKRRRSPSPRSPSRTRRLPSRDRSGSFFTRRSSSDAVISQDRRGASGKSSQSSGGSLKAERRGTVIVLPWGGGGFYGCQSKQKLSRLWYNYIHDRHYISTRILIFISKEFLDRARSPRWFGCPQKHAIPNVTIETLYCDSGVPNIACLTSSSWFITGTPHCNRRQASYQIVFMIVSSLSE